MQVVRFSDQYGAVASLYEVDEVELRARDERQRQELQRWFALESGVPIGAVVTWLRPDDRLFLIFTVRDVRAYGPLTEAVTNALGRPVSVTCDGAEADRLIALEAAGFRIEMTNDRFLVPFDVALRFTQRAWVPTGYEIRSVADVDEDRVFDLDNKVRNLVPGTDGWVGDRQWFGEEIRSDEFERDAYLVAVERATDAYVGLLRIWRNPDGPRLGLLAVLPEHRKPSLAAGLLKRGLQAASRWGHDDFKTETSPANSNTHRVLLRLGLDPVGRFHQLTCA